MATLATDIPSDLVERAMQLPPASRERLGHLLLNSVAKTPAKDTAVADMIRSRMEQLVRGEVELLDADEVVAELEARYAKDPSP